MVVVFLAFKTALLVVVVFSGWCVRLSVTHTRARTHIHTHTQKKKK